MVYKEPKRARRLRDALRMHARVQTFLRHTWHDRPGSPDLCWTDDEGQRRSFATWADIFDWRAHAASRRQGNRACCSCLACGNPRRHGQDLTRQERRAELRQQDVYDAPAGHPARAQVDVSDPSGRTRFPG
jgi:hypothetical protein